MQKVAVSRLISIADGDTFRCDVDTWPKLFGYHIPVRVRGINCPERNASDEALKALSERARKFTYEALTNAKKIVLLNVSRGKYFRLVADVEYDGRNLASELLQGGLAVVYRMK